MQIIENQTVSLNNLIDYQSKIKKRDILDLVHFISEHLYVLGLEQNGNIISSLLSEQNDEAVFEIFIPVNGDVKKCDEFGYKDAFILTKAIVGRHEGSLDDLDKNVRELKNYIVSNNYEPASGIYYSVIREGGSNVNNCIIDVYIRCKVILTLKI